MNLFEKIFNHQIISRLEDSGAFMVTSHERSWLKSMLEHPASRDALAPETLDKLERILEEDQTLDHTGSLLQKAGSAEPQVFHPLLRPLRRYMMQRTGIRISYWTKAGRLHSERYGFPYKLEYSMVKRAWYLLWHDLQRHAFMSTRLDSIRSVEPEAVDKERAEKLLARIQQTLEGRKRTVLIEIVPLYNEELSRILYAFSCFEREVEYDDGTDTYRVRLTLSGDEMEYLLSKLRFLGKRVRVAEGAYLKQRMLESASKALDRYGVQEDRSDLRELSVGTEEQHG